MIKSTFDSVQSSTHASFEYKDNFPCNWITCKWRTNMIFLGFLLSDRKAMKYSSKSILSFFDLVLGDFSGTSDKTSSSGGDKTDLGTWGAISSASRWITDMLMISSSEGMFYWVHSDTSDLWPAVSLYLVLMVSTSSLKIAVNNRIFSDNKFPL